MQHPRARKTGCRALWCGVGALGLLVGLLAQGSARRFRGGPPEATGRGNVPEWHLAPGFEQDAFVFARIKYRSTMDRTSYAWWTDYRDADLNLSYRLQQVTSLKVDPEGRVIELNPEQLQNHPFVFMSGVPAIVMDDREIRILRDYLLNGGFLLVDDFWGERPWAHFEREVLSRMFPGRAVEELPLDHPVFHCVFHLRAKPQIPNVGFALRNRGTGVTWEVEDGRTPHYRGISDDRGRLMVLACHNTDLGDGWEEEGTDPYYFAEFSEPKAYPLGINIVFYALTH